MAESTRRVRVVLDTGCLVEFMGRMRGAVDANPPGEGEAPMDWMRRVIDAACWVPEGWADSSEATSPASEDEGD